MSPEGDASLGSAVLAFVALPFVVAVVVPLALIGLSDGWGPLGALDPPGVALFVLGLGILLVTVREFFTQGRGTLAPWNPPRRLVTTGLFAHCRNPMYVGVLATILGEAWALRSPGIAVYAVVLAIAFDLRVRTFEEPWAQARFPDHWPAYRNAVPRWWPRRTPWRSD